MKPLQILSATTLAAAVAFAAATWAQQIAPMDQPSFEVASVKKHVAENSGMMGARMIMGGPPGDTSRWAASNVTAKMLIGTAYSMKPFQIAGGPSWIESERFDIDAKVEDSQAQQLQKLQRQEQQAQQALMLRSLLADRFKLQVTRSTKEGTVLELVVAKGGTKLKEVPAPPDPQAGQQAPPPGPPPPERGGGPPAPPPGAAMMMMGSNGLVTARMSAATIPMLMSLLSAQLGQQIVDKTGLPGHYDITLQFSTQGLGGGMFLGPAMMGGTDSSADNGGASLFTALQEQLGLKLESTKGPVDTLTIDHIEEPTEN